MARTHVLIAGGGYVGFYTALGLERLLEAEEVEITLVSPENYMLYQPLLPEVASGTLEPRHVVVSLRRALRRTEVVTGRLTGLDHDRRTATLAPRAGEPVERGYDHVVVGLGSETRVLPIPGLADQAIGFASLAEAIHLRNHVLGRLEAAQSTSDPAVRRRALTFVFVGGGYTGVEVLGELEDMARSASRWYPSLTREQQRWILVEATGGVLPTVDESLGRFVLRQLRRRGIDVRLGTQLESAEDGCMRLSDGEELEADTLVWSAGVTPHPLIAELGLPVDDKGRLVVDRCLRVEGAEGAWGAGDGAAVPRGEEGEYFPPTAQYAEREARRLAGNIAAAIRGRQPEPFEHEAIGELVTIGRYKGVGEIRGMRIRGFLPWFLRRTYYAWRIPTLERKVRMVAEWTVALFFPRDVVELGSVKRPREPIERAADPGRVA